MRVLHLFGMILVAGLSSACGGRARTTADSADVARRAAITHAVTMGSGVALTPVDPYSQQRDPSGWTGTSPPPTARGGGPADPSNPAIAGEALNELRRTPELPEGTAPEPTGASPTNLEHDETVTPSPALPAPQPGEKKLPPDVGPPPPSPDVERPER